MIFFSVEAVEVVVMTVESVADMAVVVAAVVETPTLADKVTIFNRLN